MKYGAYAGLFAAVAGIALPACRCHRGGVAAQESVVHVERRDTTLYRPAYSLENVLHLPNLAPDSAISRTVRDTATGAALFVSYQPATRAVVARLEVAPETITVPRVRESITTTTTITPPCPPKRGAWWRILLAFFAGMVAGVSGVGLFRAILG